MKKILLYILIGTILGGVLLGTASVVYAQLTPQQIKDIAAGEGTSEQDVRDNLASDPGLWESRYRSIYLPPTQTEREEQQERAGAAQEQAAKAKAAAERERLEAEKKFNCTYPWNWGRCAAEPIANMALWVSARLLWIAGILLNLTLHYTLNMNTLLQSLPIVDIGWKIIRDIANIVFIFIALWSGISITLGIRAEKAWGLLAHMVLVALFINFSLFITKAVVDASNVAALHFYSLIKQPGHENDWDGGLSDAFMAGINIQSLYNTSQLEAVTAADKSYVRTVGKDQALSTVNIVLIGVFGSFFMVVAAWVFFAAAIMFIIRAVVLIMLMILSPLAFVAWLLPGAAGLASAWWSKLWSQSFFAPLYLALAYVVVATINSPTFKGIGVLGEGPTSFAAAFTGFNSASVIIVLNFIILIGLMVGCLIVAQSLGAKGSEMAIAGWKKIQGGAVGMIKGTSGAGIRTALRLGETSGVRRIGRAMGLNTDKISVRYWNERLSQSKLGNTALGKMLRQQTIGRLAEGKIFGKSTEEAYREAETDTSKIRAMGFIRQARQAAGALQPLRQRQHLLQAARFTAGGNFAQAQQSLAAAQAPPSPTPQQQQQIATTQQALQQARAVSPQQQAQIQTAQQALTQAQQTLAAAPNNAILQQIVTTAQQRLAQAQTPTAQQQQRIAAAQQALQQAQTPPLSAQQQQQIATAQQALTNAQQALTQANSDAKTYEDEHGAEIVALLRKISEALARPSPKEFVELTPKNDFFIPELMDIEVLPSDKFNALEKDEHVLTEVEKEEAARARMRRLLEEAERADKRNEWYHDAMQRYQRAINPFEQQLKTEEDQPLAQQNQQLIQSLKQQIAQIEMPQQPTWESPGLHRALRNMRGTEELTNWYRYQRGFLNKELLVQTVMQGLWNEMRKSDQVDSGFKEDFRVIKRAYVLYSGDLTTGFDPNITKKLHQDQAVAVDALRKLANKQLTKLGPEEYFGQFSQAFVDEDNVQQRSIAEQYQDVIANHNARHPQDTVTDAISDQERRDLRFNTGMTMYRQVSQNLASDEFTMMPGLLRDLYVVMRHLERSQITHYASRDLDVKIPMVEFLIKQFQDEILGKGKMSSENLQIFSWFVNQGGADFIPFENLKPELKDSYEQIKSLIGRKDARSQPSIYGRQRDYEREPMNSPVMLRINQVRAQNGLPPLTADNQPFGRIGAVA